MKMNFKLCAALFVVAFASRTIHAEDADALSSKYFDLAGDEKNEAEAKKTGNAFIEAAGKDADALNEFAWKILTEESIKKRDMDLAMRVAKLAFDASEGKSAAIVDTYARAFFDSGKTEEGIKWQKKAIEVCSDDGLKSELEETLKKYQEKANEKKETKK